MWPYIVPSQRWSLQAGNDFYELYYVYKLYLLEALNSGHRIPLWSPTESCGYPFYSNPFTASFYPPNLVLLFFYKIAGGYSPHDHQIFTIAGICICCVGLFIWLRSFDLSIRACIFGAAVMGTSLKITELMRFPNAVHAAAWFPWVLFGMNLILQHTTWRRGIAVLAFSTLMLLTAGYPYYVYYLQFLIGPYFIFLSVSSSRRAFFRSANSENMVGRWRYLVGIITGFTIPLVLCAPYLAKMKALIAQTQDRTGTSFEYSTVNGWSVNDTIGSLIYPPASSVEGWYFFGILALLLIGIYVANLFRTRDKQERLFVVLTIAWFVIITALSFGRESSLFILLWHYWPGFSALRVWPRINILFIPVLAILLARSYEYWESAILSRERKFTIWQQLKYWKWLPILYGIIAVGQWHLWSKRIVDDYWLHFFEPMNYLLVNRSWFLITGLAAFFTLTITTLLATSRPFPPPAWSLNIVLSVFLICNAVAVAPIGIQQWSFVSTPPYEQRKCVDLERDFVAALGRPRIAIYGTLPISPTSFPAYNVGGISNWYFGRYVNFTRSYGFDPSNREIASLIRRPPGLCELLGMSNGKRLFFVKTLSHDSAADFIEDERAAESECLSARIQQYNGDILKVSVILKQSVYFCFIDNWDPDWTATVDGQPVKIELLFGTFKAVHLNEGTHEVSFRYAPFW